MRKHLLIIYSALLFVLITTASFAQGVTTATINGRVYSSKNTAGAEKTTSSQEILPGANVIAIHVPTGSQYGTSTREDGKFTIPNVKIGGPYKVTVSFVGYDNSEKNDIYLALGGSADLTFALAESGTELAAVQVTAAVTDVFNSDRTGASTSISNEQIRSLPTLSRSFNDYVRLTPQSNGGNGFAGRSDGFNNITVDGALFNNAFGLSGTVGGQANAQPISLDAVDQISTSIAPYDVKQGSFTGAGINVVTRSGTNEFTGSVYDFFRNESFVGDKVRGVTSPVGTFNLNNIGFRLGGPIIKDKLFFFINYENEKRNDPGTTYIATRNGATGSNVSQAQATDLDALSSFLVSNYGYNPGPYEGYKLQSNSDKGTAKIDWNISQNHKLSVKYNFLNSFRDVAPSGSGAISSTVGRSPNLTALPYLGAYYRINNNVNSFIAELNSNFGTKYANKFQVGYSEFRDFRETPTSGKLFPLVDIGNGAGQPFTSFGYEPFSANNILNTNVFQISDNFDIYKGKHVITLGTYNEFYHFENGFDPFYYGAYQFNSLADFYSSAAGTLGKIQQYQLGYSASPDGNFPLVKVDAYQLGFYAQDKYDVTQNFNVTVGLRADIPTIQSTIGQNTQAEGFTFRDGQKINTSQVQQTSVLWSPRVGFNWDVKGDRTTQIRGGTGIFTGRVPYVWISNQASNNGLLFGNKSFNASTGANLVFSPDVDAYRPGKNGNPSAAASSTYNLAVTDKNFSFPQVWRTNIAIDQKLPGGITASLDLAFTKDVNAVYHQNINLPNATFNAKGADTRPIFYKTFPVSPNPQGNVSNPTANSRINGNISDAILLKNTNDGYSYFATIQLKKTFGFGLNASAAYTYTDARSVNDGGSIAQSIWRDRQISGDPNASAVSYSNFLNQHRIIVSLNYRKEYLGFMATSVGLFYEAAQAGRFSYTYSGDMNGDNSGGGGNDLIYVPRNQSEIALLDITDKNGIVLYTATQQWADLDKYISQDSYLSGRRGDYAERNGATQPWRGQLDFRLLQDFYVKVGNKRNTIQLSVDIFNVGNLLNSDWGVLKTPSRGSLLTFRGYDANQVPQFQFPYFNATTKTPLTSSFTDSFATISRWQMQLGVRYIFGN